MSTSQLVALDLAVSILAAGSWVAASVVIARTANPRATARLTLSLLGVASLALVGDVIVVLALWRAGWWFVQEKVSFALPLLALVTVAALVIAVPGLLKAARGLPARGALGARTALAAGALSAGAGLAARFVVGYPLTILPAAALLLLVAVATWLAYAIFAGEGRRLVVGLVVLTSLGLAASVGVSWLTSVASPVALANAHQHAGQPVPTDQDAVSVQSLVTPGDVRGTVREFTLTAAQQQVTLPSGQLVDAWTFGSVPGPELRVEQGDIVQVTLYNKDIDSGVTLHWHGYDVPNAEDGVAGVTQDAVLPGESFTYRFVADEPGTYWYHTHQNSAEGIQRGLYGSLIVEPPGGVAEDLDLVLPVHTFGRSVLLGDSNRAESITAEAGSTVRLRLINTNQLPIRLRLSGGEFQVVAVDGRDLVGPSPVDGAALRIPAGGRMDVSFTMPAGGMLLSTDSSSASSLLVAPPGSVAPTPDRSRPDLDLLSYGTPTVAALPKGDGLVEATMVLDRLPRFLSGAPVNGYTVNGEVFPHIPSIEVTEGNVVELTVANRGSDTHPMHIHGHHVLVLSRNGIPATGSPLWLDTFDVQPGEVWVVGFIADNPGIWMDHCHNLEHAAEGMMMALHYRGVTSPFDHGGDHGNSPE